jgi:hypothetical protein
MLSEDPARDGLNYYTYSNNNPIMFVDPLGLYAVGLREWYGSQLKYISDYYSNASGSLTWDNNTKTAHVSLSANGYSGYVSFTAGVNGSYIINDRIYVENTSLWNTFRNVIDPPLEYRPVRDTAVIASVVVATVKGPGLVNAAGKALAPLVPPVIDKTKQVITPVIDKASSIINFIGNKAIQTVGTPFVQNGIRLQNNVDPRTLIPGRDLSAFPQVDVNAAWNAIGVKRIIVDALGKVWDGNHRLAYALQHNLPVNIQIGW